MIAEVAKKYDIATLKGSKHQIQGFGTIDFDTLTLKEADRLVKAGFPYLVKKPAEKLK